LVPAIAYGIHLSMHQHAAFPGEALMPRYFFHVRDGTQVLDEVGVDLPDIASAQATAVQLSAEILRDGVITPMWRDLRWWVEVTDRPQLGGRRFFVLQISIIPTRTPEA
jgi:uncharacterized protein DUF6894